MKTISLIIQPFAPTDSLKALRFLSDMLSQMHRFTDCGQSLKGRSLWFESDKQSNTREKGGLLN